MGTCLIWAGDDGGGGGAGGGGGGGGGDVAADSTRALGALAYYLRAARTVIHAIAQDSDRGVDEVLALIGQRLASDTA